MSKVDKLMTGFMVITAIAIGFAATEAALICLFRLYVGKWISMTGADVGKFILLDYIAAIGIVVWDWIERKFFK